MINEQTETVEELRDALVAQDNSTSVSSVKAMPKFQAILLFRDELCRQLMQSMDLDILDAVPIAGDITSRLDFQLSGLAPGSDLRSEFKEAIEAYARMVFKIVYAWRSEAFSWDSCYRIVEGSKFVYR